MFKFKSFITEFVILIEFIGHQNSRGIQRHYGRARQTTQKMAGQT
jgi:hypothetical protein